MHHVGADIFALRMSEEAPAPASRRFADRAARKSGAPGESRRFPHLGAVAGALLVAIGGAAVGDGIAASTASATEAKKPATSQAAASAARPLPQFAPKSADAAIKEVSLCSSETNQFDPRTVGNTFRHGVKNIVVWYRWEGSPMGRRMDVRWSREGKVVLTQGENADEAAGESSWTLAMSSGGPLPAGGYRVELIEEGKTVSAIPFQIK
jgi:hypothetical protein